MLGKNNNSRFCLQLEKKSGKEFKGPEAELQVKSDGKGDMKKRGDGENLELHIILTRKGVEPETGGGRCEGSLTTIMRSS